MAKKKKRKGDFRRAKTPEGRVRQNRAISRYYAEKEDAKRKKTKKNVGEVNNQSNESSYYRPVQVKPIPARAVNQSRTAGGKVPQGRTITTRDNYLGDGGKTGSTKERPVVVIEANDKNELAVVPLSSRKGNNRTLLKDYEQGQSYFKHFVEIEDDEGNPIVVNEKFRENHPNLDVSIQDVELIKDKVLNHSATMQSNKKKMKKFRGEDDNKIADDDSNDDSDK